MLKTTDFIREFPVKMKTDRDCELVLFLEFLRSHPVESLLDIGAHYSVYNNYAQEVRALVKRYDGIDIIDDPEVKQVLDNFYVGNAITYPLKQYDMVACISTIEHSGVSTYKVDDIQKEQERLFMRCLELTNKYMWISFPTGLPYVYPNELSIITEKQLKRWEILTSNFKVKERFFYSQGPQAGHPWYEHNKREFATIVPYVDYVGNCSIAVLEIEK